MKEMAMVNKVGSCLLFAAVSFFALGVNAQTASSTKPSDENLKLYIQGSWGMQKLRSPGSTGMAMNLNGSESKNAARAALGLQLDEHMGVEVSYFQLPGTAIRTTVGDATYKGNAYAFSFTGKMPIHTDVDLVGRIGLGQSDVDVSVPETMYKSNSRQNLSVWGLGIRFAIDKSIDVTLDYDNLGTVGKYALGDHVKANLISLGLRFKF